MSRDLFDKIWAQVILIHNLEDIFANIPSFIDICMYMYVLVCILDRSGN